MALFEVTKTVRNRIGLQVRNHAKTDLSLINALVRNTMFGRNKHRAKQDHLVLLVDDDKGQLDVFATWMAAVRPGVHVRTATSVEEGLDLITTHTFSLIISDYSIPHAGAGLDIFEAAIQSGISKANFIMLSGTTDNLPDEIRLVSKGDLVALEAAIQQALP